jgi:integrase
MARSFYLYQRKNGIFYAEFLSGNGDRILYRSTKSRDKVEAAAIVGRWLTDGVSVKKSRTKKTLKAAVDYKSVMDFINNGDIDDMQAYEIAKALKVRGLLTIGISPGNKGKQLFTDFLYNFWDYDKSLYFRDKRAHGKSITRRTCHEAKQSVKRNYEPYFKDRLLSDVTRNNIRDFGLSLRDRLSAKTVNNVIHVCSIALRWAYREKIIPENITEGIGGFTGKTKKRDILTDVEIERLKMPEFWENRKAYIAFYVAITSALRSGEIRALKHEDIGDSVLYVRNGYNDIDGLKAPKNEEERKVYLLPEVKALLNELVKENSLSGADIKFIFFSETDYKKPCSSSFLLDHLRKAIKNAGIEINGRKIDFHSCRHYVITKWADNTGDLRQAAKVAGHKDLKQTAHYSDHIEEAEIVEMGKKAANILQFKKKEGA